MSKFHVEFFISRRIASRKGAERNGIMTGVATITVAIGMAVMIVAMAVIAGFRTQITSTISGFGGHVQILSVMNGNSLETTPIERDSILAARIASLPMCREVYPFAVKGGILRTDGALQGVMLKGLDGTYDWSFFRSHLIEGDVPRVTDSLRTKDILVSATVRDMLGLEVGGGVEMLLVREGQPPRRDRFQVCGVYRTGYDELDRTVVPTDIRNVQRLNGWDSLQITGYEAFAADIDHIDKLDEAINGVIDNPAPGQSDQKLITYDIRSRFPNIFSWLRTQDVNGAVIITIMILVALLNMISALLIILLERARMIGTLKALGMSNSAVQRIFCLRSAFIVLKGMLWGNLVGLGLCGAQLMWHLVKLDRANYFLTEVPIDLGWNWWAALNVGAFVLIVGLMTLPTLIVSYMKPDSTLRFR